MSGATLLQPFTEGGGSADGESPRTFQVAAVLLEADRGLLQVSRTSWYWDQSHFGHRKTSRGEVVWTPHRDPFNPNPLCFQKNVTWMSTGIVRGVSKFGLFRLNFKLLHCCT